MDLRKDKSYLAMFSFLENLYERTNSDELAGLLGSMSLLEDGIPADAAILSDWRKALSAVEDGTVKVEMKLDGPAK